MYLIICEKADIIDYMRKSRYFELYAKKQIIRFWVTTDSICFTAC